MRRLLSMLMLFCAPPLSAGDVELGESDQAAVRVAAADFAEGAYEGDRARLERALHERLVKRAYLPGKGRARRLDEVDKAALLERNTPQNAARPAKAPKRAEIEILDGVGNIAAVKLRMDGWVDYLHLVRGEDGEWRVVDVLGEPVP